MSTSYRERVMSPSRYRRQTIGIVPSVTHSVPNSARSSMTPRPSSALDRRWVHHSHGDLSVDMDLQIHPRLQSDFYQELYQRYPQAFRHRRENRETGRKLFNSRPHVTFKDAISDFDNYQVWSQNVGDYHGSLKHLTNWDHEVGQYMRHKSRSHSRDCVTSVEPSDCSGSVLSVTQRLRLNQQSLNKLLNEKSPFRRRFDKDNVQYDSGTDQERENVQSLEDYMLEKSKERSRNRKQQRKIIIQRKINTANENNVDSDKENEFKKRRWMSKSASPTRRNQIPFSLPREDLRNINHDGQHVDVDALMAESDLKVDTLLEQISNKMSSPDSPPDSAIDIGTSSVHSFVQGGDKNQTVGSNQAGSNRDRDLESSPGSSASTHCFEIHTATTLLDENPLHNDDDELMKSYTLVCAINSERPECNDITNENDPEIQEMNKIVENYASSEYLINKAGAGLLQLYTSELGVEDFTKSASLDTLDNKFENEALQANAVNDDQIDTIGNMESEPSTSNDNGVILTTTTANVETDDEHLATLCELGDDITQGLTHSDHADIEISSSNKAFTKSMATPKDSDVDSGIGYSSACTDALPPRGRATQRDDTMKLQPVKGDHHLLPSRAEVDVDILDEVNLVHFAHDLRRSHDHRARGHHSSRDDTDDTDVHLGVAKYIQTEKNIAEKYRRARSPSPYILHNHRQSPGLRPKSAPSFVQSELDLRVVNISLSSESLSDQSLIVTNGVQTPKNRDSSTKWQKTTSLPTANTKTDPHSKQKTDNLSKYASMPNLAGDETVHSKSNNVSSHLNKHQRKSVTSNSSYDSSISLLSESESEPTTQIYTMNAKDATNTLNTHNSIPYHYPGTIDDHDFQEVDLESEPRVDIKGVLPQQQTDISGKRGVYKPSVTSPRVKEKRLKIRNILKNKKGAFSPPGDGLPMANEKAVPTRIYAKDRGSNYDSESTDRQSDSAQSRGGSTGEVKSSNLSERDTKTMMRLENGSVIHRENGDRQDSVNAAHRDTDSVEKFIYGASESRDVEMAKPVLLDGQRQQVRQLPRVPDMLHDSSEGQSERTGRKLPSIEKGDNSEDGSYGSLERPTSPAKAQPPMKPLRNKNKNKNLPPGLNLSKYKIRTNVELQNGDRNSNGTSNESSPVSADCSRSTRHQELFSAEPRSADRDPAKSRSGTVDSEIEVLEPHNRNLEQSRALSGSKTSLKGIKQATKGKFKAFKKAISMDRGIDTVGTDPNPGGHKSTEGKGGHSGFLKIKKAPSLKSITSFFSRKKKRGKFTIEDTDAASARGSSLTISGEPSNGKPRNWASCQTLTTVDPSSSNGPIRSKQAVQPMGKVRAINHDGTQVIQLVKPEDGPIGFFIAKGNPKYGNGIFVSRFAATRPEQCFAGLLGVGDEIIEVNGHLVRDLSQDAVYSLISASPIVILKVLPFIARKDV